MVSKRSSYLSFVLVVLLLHPEVHHFNFLCGMERCGASLLSGRVRDLQPRDRRFESLTGLIAPRRALLGKHFMRYMHSLNRKVKCRISKACVFE